MTLGMQLSHSFNMLVTPYIHKNKSIYETKLFDKLIDSFSSLCGYEVARIHGNKYQVTYPDALGWFAQPRRCELGDICIIAYSKRKKKARLVVVQNKVARTTFNVLSTDGCQINANLVQYELLKTRPRFEYTCGKLRGTMSNLIRTERYPSVCVYGNFYMNAKGEADMAAITANQFQFKHPPIPFPCYGKHPAATIIYSGPFENLATRNGSGDFYAADNITDFGDLLEDLYIGKPIGKKEKDHIEKELEDAFNAGVARASNNFYTALQNFQMISLDDSDDISLNDEFDFDGDYPMQEQYNPLHFCRTLLLLNVDYEADYENCLDLPM